MLMLLFRYQLRYIHPAFINLATSILCGRQWHGFWRICWSPTSYWRSLRLWHCVMWRFVLLLRNRGQMRWINDWIIQLRRHSYHRWWQHIACFFVCWCPTNGECQFLVRQLQSCLSFRTRKKICKIFLCQYNPN